MRRIIFLDIDGVLNSVKYDRERTDKEGNIDETRMVLLISNTPDRFYVCRVIFVKTAS